MGVGECRLETSTYVVDVWPRLCGMDGTSKGRYGRRPPSPGVGTIEREVDERNTDFFFFQSPKFLQTPKAYPSSSSVRAETSDRCLSGDPVGTVTVTTSSWPHEVQTAVI
jgi:hypothetical protein